MDAIPAEAQIDEVIPAPTLKLAPVVKLEEVAARLDDPAPVSMATSADDDEFGGLDKLFDMPMCDIASAASKNGAFQNMPDAYDMTPEEAESAAAFHRELEKKRQEMPMGSLLTLSVAANLARVTRAELLNAIAGNELSAVKSLRSGFDKYRVYKKTLDAWVKGRRGAGNRAQP